MITIGPALSDEDGLMSVRFGLGLVSLLFLYGRSWALQAFFFASINPTKCAKRGEMSRPGLASG